MKIFRFGILSLVLAGAIGVLLQAQSAVTVQLRNGDRFAATLLDWRTPGFDFLVDGRERLVPKGEIAMVDFGGNVDVPASAFDRVGPLDHLIVLKNGDFFVAEWVDVGGTSPQRIELRTAGGERNLSSAEVARIYLAKPAVTEAKPIVEDDVVSGGAQADGAIAVLATQAWTDTGIQVRAGEMLRFEASRSIRIGAGDGNEITAAGATSNTNRALPRVLPVRTLPLGALVGRIGNGQPFAIGASTQSIRMPSNGRLRLGINDLNFDGHSGWFRVVVVR